MALPATVALRTPTPLHERVRPCNCFVAPALEHFALDQSTEVVDGLRDVTLGVWRSSHCRGPWTEPWDSQVFSGYLEAPGSL